MLCRMECELWIQKSNSVRMGKYECFEIVHQIIVDYIADHCSFTKFQL